MLCRPSHTKNLRVGFIAIFLFFAALLLCGCATNPGFHEREGFVRVPGGMVWYRIVGSGDATPVILLHGGPGSASDYLKPLEKLAIDRPVIFYDQLGCGKSDHPDNDQLWHIERFVDELARIREALNLKEIHLYGHSWGTMLAVDYMLTKPTGIKSLVLASPALSVSQWVSDADSLIEKLPFTTRQAIRRHQKDGTTDTKEYEDAVAEYLKLHLCRLAPWPEDLMRSFDNSNPRIYKIMWGPSEFYPTGNLKTYERIDRLGEIDIPTFFTAGRYDEATPAATQLYRSKVPNATIRIFEQSSHLAMFEEKEEYIESIREFFKSTEVK
ncbi:MAG: proline iminopeptidase-family hydrolase [Syntrophorhabdus sp.]